MTLYNGEDTSSRFAVLDRPMLPPGVCAVCGSPSNPVIDFNLSVEWFGVVYFCLVCLNAAAEKAGLYEARQIQVKLNRDLVGNLAVLAANLTEIKEAEADVLSGFDRFNRVLNLLLSLNGVPTEIPTDDTEAEPTELSSDGQSDNAIIDEGSSSVPSDSSDDAREPVRSFQF